MSKEGILSALNKVYGVNAVAKVKDLQKVEVKRDTTGSFKIDAILGGGIPEGKLVEAYGPESSGKTSLALHIIGEKQKKEKAAAIAENRPERSCGFIDMEHALDLHWAKILGVDVEELVLTQPENGEQALEIAHKLVTSGEFCFIVIDSVAALRPKKEIEGEMGDAIVGLQAKLMSQACPKLSIAANHHNCTVFFINQVREKIGVMFGSPETTPGGNALKFYSSIRLDIRGSQAVTASTGERIGNVVKVKCVKNKVSAPFGVCETRLMYGIGFDKVWEIFSVAVEMGVIERSGSWFSFGGARLGQGEQNVIGFLRQDPDTLEAVSFLIKQNNQ